MSLNNDLVSDGDNLFFLDDLIEFTEVEISIDSDEVLHNNSDTENDNNISSTMLTKRKIDDIYQSDSNDEDNGLGSNFHKKICNTIPDSYSNIMKFPSKLFAAMNQGDFLTIDNLLNNIVDKNCSLKWCRNAFKSQMSGLNTLSTFFKVLLNAMPDAIVLLRDIKCIKSTNNNNITLVKCKLRMSGTMTDIKYWEDFYGFKMPSLDVLDYMDLSKLSIRETTKLRKLAAQFRENQVLLQVFGKMKLNLYIDSSTYKVVLYEDLFSISSFNPIKIIV